MSTVKAVTGSVSVPSGHGTAQSVDIGYQLNVPEGGSQSPSTVLLLVAGGTYNRRYWDLPDPAGGTDRYSFVKAANESGYATLAIDTLGRGSSTRPHSSECTLLADARICHELVQKLRAGTLVEDGTVGAFDNVVAVGHSWGTVTTWLTASEYQDLEGVILTGGAHPPTSVDPIMIVANTDPAFADLNLDDGYLTTPPGRRADQFYEPGDYDPALVAWDDEHKDVWTVANADEVAELLAKPLDIRAHALLVVGELDPFCTGVMGAKLPDADTFLGEEAPYLGEKVQSVEAVVVAGAGHCINGAVDAPAWFASTIDWLGRRIGGAGV